MEGSKPASADEQEEKPSGRQRAGRSVVRLWRTEDRTLTGQFNLMLILITKKAEDAILQKAAEDFEGYIKFVVDIRRKVLTVGGKLHADGEQMLLQDGSRQADLWGGGLELETGEVDYDSLINIRVNQGNASREVLDKNVRDQMLSIVRDLLR
jgi:hypothetical protein